MTNAAQQHSAKRLARLAAVQGLYQIALTDNSADQIIKNFREQPSILLQEENDLSQVDQDLFGAIMIGVSKDNATLDEMIMGAFDNKASAERIEILLRAILRAGTFELHTSASIPTGVIINDYVDVTHAFFGAKEPGLVNAVLDKLAKNLRSE